MYIYIYIYMPGACADGGCQVRERAPEGHDADLYVSCLYIFVVVYFGNKI